MNTSMPPVPQKLIRRTRFTTAIGVGALALLALAGFAGAAEVPVPSYSVENLGVLAGDSTSGASGINAMGDVVGWSTGEMGSRAFVYTDEKGMTALPSLTKSGSSFARDINDHREVVGTSGAIRGVSGRAVLWTEGRVFDLAPLGGVGLSDGWAINNQGQIVGSAQVGDLFTAQHAFLYSPESGIVDLTPNSLQAAALDINNEGAITGYYDAPDSSLHAFLREGEEIVDLGALAGFDDSMGSALNDKGLVVGTATTSQTKDAHMFSIATPESMKDLNGVLPVAFALGVNNSRTIVGYISGAPTTRAILYTETNGIQDLNSLISPRSGWVLESATDINDSGVIVGYAYNSRTKRSHAVRLRPTLTSIPAPNPSPFPTLTRD